MSVSTLYAYKNSGGEPCYSKGEAILSIYRSVLKSDWEEGGHLR
ncbi:MAG: hypothetical protein ACWGQW_17035 [bacterium]